MEKKRENIGKGRRERWRERATVCQGIEKTMLKKREKGGEKEIVKTERGEINSGDKKDGRKRFIGKNITVRRKKFGNKEKVNLR